MLKIFCVYDSKAEAYLNPVFAVNAAVVVRSFTAAAVDPNSDFGRHPADYTLFELGEFDPGKGLFSLLEVKQVLGTALEYASAANGDNDV